MKKRTLRPLMALASACLLPTAVLAQTNQTPQTPQSAQSPQQQPPQPVNQPINPAELPLTQPLGLPPLPDPAAARRTEEPRTYEIRATAGIERDDNVLRGPAGTERSDEIGVFGVGIRVAPRLGQQRILLDAEATTFRHSDLSNLDYTTLNYSAIWNWRISNVLEGVASADRRQYRDVGDTAVGALGTIGRRTERNELLEGGYRLDGAWRVLAGVQQQSSRSSDPRSLDAFPTVRSLRLGTSYDFASGSTITARVRRGDGEYEGFPAVGDFEDNEVELTMRWLATAKTSLDARLAYLNRSHDRAPTRDFDGLVGFAHVGYEVSPKIRLVTGFSRDLGSYVFGTGGHVQSSRVFFAPVYRVTERISVNARYERETRDWEDAAGSPDAGREDRTNTLSAGVDYSPRRFVTASATLRRENRKSSLPAVNYKANVIGLALKFSL
ncbi:MAG TPA: outer membrane beta-barrel protein [Ramlibacter sp.]|nr:outer membrane beta-barrel protein [Ramlibacter sp.]